MNFDRCRYKLCWM